MEKKIYYRVIGLFFLILFLVLCIALPGTPQWLMSSDQFMTAMVRSISPMMKQPFIWYTKLANPTTLIVFTVIGSFLFLKKQLFVEAIWLVINTGVIAGIVNPLVKNGFMRQRPALVHLVTEHSYSFPSGHSTGSVLFYGTLIFLLPQLIKRKRTCLALQVFLGIGILLVGISRSYLGVHFPSDVVGGFSLGLAWLFLTYPIYQRTRKENQRIDHLLKRQLRK